MSAFDPAKFYAEMRASKLLGATLEQSEVDGCNAILEACKCLSVSHTAYDLATAFHETAGTMQPIKEYGSDSYFFRMYDKDGARPHIAAELGNTQPGDGVKFPGMGYVQSTGRKNARRAGKELGLPIEENPKLLMKPDVAAKVLRRGMDEGWFTGKRLADYLPSSIGTLTQFKNSRRIVNGTDKADLIAGHALTFQKALVAAGW